MNNSNQGTKKLSKKNVYKATAIIAGLSLAIGSGVAISNANNSHVQIASPAFNSTAQTAAATTPTQPKIITYINGTDMPSHIYAGSAAGHIVDTKTGIKATDTSGVFSASSDPLNLSLHSKNTPSSNSILFPLLLGLGIGLTALLLIGLILFRVFRKDKDPEEEHVPNVEKRLFWKKKALSDVILFNKMANSNTLVKKPMKTTETFRQTQILKHRILRKHLILINTNMIVKIFMIIFSLASAIFFSVVSSGAVSSDPQIKYLISMGHMAYVWPIIVSVLVLLCESVLLVLVYEKRYWLDVSYYDNGYGDFDKIKRSTSLSLLYYSLTLILVTVMFALWFSVVDSQVGNYSQVFSSSFPFYIDSFGAFKVLFIVFCALAMTFETAMIIWLAIVYLTNTKYWEVLIELTPYAKKDMVKANRWKGGIHV